MPTRTSPVTYVNARLLSEERALHGAVSIRGISPRGLSLMLFWYLGMSLGLEAAPDIYRISCDGVEIGSISPRACRLRT